MVNYRGATRNDPLLWHDVDPGETKNWWETRNFLPLSGRQYGCPFMSDNRQIHIERIDADAAEQVNDVTVVWVAPHQGVGRTTIVGWYKHATVYRRLQSKPRGYHATAKARNCVCLPIALRHMEVPSARARQKGKGMGQALAWFEAGAFKGEVLRFIKRYETGRLQKDQQAENERTLAEEELYRNSPASRQRIIPMHNRLSNSFRRWLTNSHGVVRVSQERSHVDVTFSTDRGTYLAELKVCNGIGARRGIREALGQLLEYNLYPGRTKARNWMVVLDEEPSTEDLAFIKRVSKVIRTRLYLAWTRGDGFKLMGSPVTL